MKLDLIPVEMKRSWLRRISLGILLDLMCQFLFVSGELSNEAAINDTKAMSILGRVMKSANNLVRPNVYGPPVVIKCDFFVQSLGPINEIDMDYSMEIYFRLQWVDERLTFPVAEPPLQVPHQEIQKIWVPDVYFPNEKEGRVHTITTPNRAVTIYPNGTVVQSTRITLRLECNMLLMSFPLDYQTCEIKISSYSFEDSQVKIIWAEGDPLEMQLTDLPQFELLNKTVGYCKLAYKAGEFSCLRAAFHLKRQIGFYVLQTYLPSILIVMLSWVSFWINKDAVPARISLGVTTVLTMTTQLSTSRSNSMRVSYPKAIDVWYASCMMFVFGALLEYALINVLSRSGDNRRNGRLKMSRGRSRSSKHGNAAKVGSESVLAGNDIEMQCPPKTDYDVMDGQEVQTPNPGVHSPRDLWVRVKRYFRTITPKDIDHASRSIFPSAFTVFNFVYWIVYTQPSLFVINSDDLHT